MSASPLSASSSVASICSTLRPGRSVRVSIRCGVQRDGAEDVVGEPARLAGLDRARELDGAREQRGGRPGVLEVCRSHGPRVRPVGTNVLVGLVQAVGEVHAGARIVARTPDSRRCREVAGHPLLAIPDARGRTPRRRRHAVLRWRYGDQLRWRLVTDRADRAGRAVRAPRLHAGRLGPRLPALPPPRHAVRDPAARPRRRHRAGVPRDRGDPPAGARARACGLPRAAVRLVHDAARARRPRRPRGRAARGSTGSTSTPIVAALGDARGRGGLPGRPRRGAHRRGHADRGAGQGRADRTATSATRRPRWSSSTRAGGSRPAASSPSRPTTSLLANLDPTLERTPPPEDPLEALEAFPYGLTTYEVAAVMTPNNGSPDPAGRRGRADRPRRRRPRHPRVAGGRGAVARSVPAASRYRSGPASNGARSSGSVSPLIAAAISSPVIGPSPTPAPSWPVATQMPVPRAADGREPVGEPGPQARPGVLGLEPRHAGHQPRPRSSMPRGDLRVDGRVEAACAPGSSRRAPCRPSVVSITVETCKPGLRRARPRPGSRRRRPCGGRRAGRRAGRAGPCAARAAGAARRRARAPRSRGRRRARPRPRCSAVEVLDPGVRADR